MAYKPKDTEERIKHRLKIARGHLNKVIAMVDGGDYCIDIINQSHAVQSALQQTDHLLLENHLQTCVVEHMKSGETAKSVDEIMKVVKKFNS